MPTNPVSQHFYSIELVVQLCEMLGQSDDTAIKIYLFRAGFTAFIQFFRRKIHVENMSDDSSQL